MPRSRGVNCISTPANLANLQVFSAECSDVSIMSSDHAYTHMSVFYWHWQNINCLLAYLSRRLKWAFLIERISAFKTWWKNQKIRRLKLCSLLSLNVFFNVLTLIWINYQCSKLHTFLVRIFLSEWGYCVYIEIPLRLSTTPTFRALKNMSAVMLHFLMHTL